MKKNSTPKQAKISLSVTARQKLDLHKAAIEKEMSLETFLLEAGEIYKDLDLEFINRMKNFSKALNWPISLVMENLCLSWIARHEALDEIYGCPNAESILIEFSVTGDGSVTGGAIYTILKNYFKNKFAREKTQRENKG
jgi:hypothetical protein